MLKLTLLQPSDKYYLPSSVLYSDYGYYSSTLKRTYQFKPCIEMVSRHQSRQLDFRGVINDGPLDRYGDRRCLHFGLEGSLSSSPSVDMSPVIDPGKWSYYNPPIKVNNDWFSCYVPDGGEYYSPLVEYYMRYSRKISKARQYVRQDDKYVLVAYATQRYPTDPITVSPRVHYLDRAMNLLCALTLPSFTVQSWDAIGQVEVPRNTGVCTTPIPFYPNGFINSDYELDELNSMLNDYIQGCLSYMTLTPGITRRQAFGDVARDAVESSRFVDTNGIQSLLELISVKGMISGMLPRVISARAAASAYLGAQYGVESQLRDFDSYVRGINRRLKMESNLPYRVVRAGTTYQLGTKGMVEYHYKIYYTSYDQDIIKVMNLLDDWAVMPRLEMAWDLIPFSFVIDWFTRFGDIIATFDSIGRMQRYDVLSVTRSEKIVRNDVLDDPLFPRGFSGVCNFFYYLRENEIAQLDMPQFSFNPPKEFHNSMELTALLIANRR